MCNKRRTGGYADLADKNYNAGESFTMPAAKVQIVAVWAKVQTPDPDPTPATKYTVTINPNNEDEPKITTVTVEEGKKVAKPADPVHPEGKIFRCWREEETQNEFDFNTPITGNITIYAFYEWRITFDLNGGTGAEIEPIYKVIWAGRGEELPSAEGITNGNKVFAGWSDGTDTYRAGDFYRAYQNVTLTAVWQDAQTPDPTPATKYTVTFDSNNGAAASKVEVEEGKTVAKPTNPTHPDGKTFLYWAMGSEEFDFTTPITENVTLKAVWKEVESTKKYNITFVRKEESYDYVISGEDPVFEEAAAGTLVTLPKNPYTLPHYTLKWWRVKQMVITEDGNSAWENIGNYQPEESFTMPAQIVKIYAVWEKSMVTISFEANGGSGEMAPVEKKFDTFISAPKCTFNPPIGKEFSYWSDTKEGIRNVGNTKLTDELLNGKDTLTLYAIWKDAGNLVKSLEGSWSGNGHTADIVGFDEIKNGIAGYGVIDGKAFATFMEQDGEYALINNNYSMSCTISAEDSTLKLDDLINGTTYIFTTQTALSNAKIQDFVGKWEKSSSNPTENWLITEDKTCYGTISLKEATQQIIGQYLIVSYMVGDLDVDVYVLKNDGTALTGWYNSYDPEKAAQSITLNKGMFYTLTVDGKLNQFVLNGKAPDASKIAAPTAPDGQKFEKWVLAGTTTEFNASAVMTADASIVAQFSAAEASSVKTYVGSYDWGSGNATKIVLNTTTGEAEITWASMFGTKTKKCPANVNGNTWEIISDNSPEYTRWWFVISPDGTTLELSTGSTPGASEGSFKLQ